ncbi:MAG: M48 family metallopeptidase [Cetobacterium sp.]
MKYDIIITKKNIKNIILRVKSDGTVTLSVPERTTKIFIESFLKSKHEWILKNLEKFKKNSVKAVDKSYKNGDNIEYLGINYILKIFPNSSNKVLIDGNSLIIYTNKEITEKNIEKILYSWYKEKAAEIFKISLNKYSNLIGENFLDFKIRRMKRRWGSCRYLSKLITLNLELIRKPQECIDYVCLHELAHLRHPHHQKEFWDFIKIYMPDWKIRKERLDKI